MAAPNGRPPLRVLFATQHYPPEVAATGQLLADLAEDLVRDGFSPTVLAGRALYGAAGAGRVQSDSVVNGVRVIRVPSTTFQRTGKAGRVANWLSYPAASFVRGLARLERPDVVVGYSSPPTTPPVAYFLARRWGARFVFYVQDLYPQVAAALGAMRQGLLYKRWEAMNRSLYRRADGVLSLGERMSQRLVGAGVPAGKITTVHNWADGELLKAVPAQENRLRKEWGLADRFVVLYSGNMGMAHDFRPIHEAILALEPRRSRLAFMFVGEGARKRELQDLVRARGFQDYVLFRDYVARDDLPLSLNAGDVGLVTMLKGTEGLVVPSKIYGHLAVGKPVVAFAPAPCELADIIEQARCGIVAESGNDLAKAIVHLMDHAGEGEAMGMAARAAFERSYERRVATERIGRLLRDIVYNPAHA